MIGDADWRFRRRFCAAAKMASAGPLNDYYTAGHVELSTPCTDVKMLAIDLETDGLDARQDPVIEAGAVGMDVGSIKLESAVRIRMRPTKGLRSESVIIHRITDDAVAMEKSEADALAQLLPVLAGKVLVAHFAEIEATFLDAACRRVFGAPFVAPFICTFQLENRWFPKARTSDGLRLGKLRAQYGLPQYSAHDGLVDAIACGELLLAQLARKNDPTLRVSDLLRR